MSGNIITAGTSAASGNNTQVGIHILNNIANNTDVEKNIINGFGESVGIRLEDSQGVTVGSESDPAKGNTIKGGRVGIDVTGGSDILVQANLIEDTTDDGIDVQNTASIDIVRNTINRAGDDGIDVKNGGDTYIFRNIIDRAGEDGIDVEDTAGAQIIRNTVRRSGDDGIEVTNSENAYILGNTPNRSGGDGIDVVDSNGAQILRNNVIRAGENAIEVRRSSNVVIDRNNARRAGQSGILADDTDNITITNNIARVNNTGIELEDVDVGLIEGNTVDTNITTGISVASSDQIRILDNDIFENGSVGLYAVGGDNLNIEVSENRFTDNPTHAEFESGIIDLTGTGNIFTDGDVALRFSNFGSVPGILSLVDDDAPGSDSLGDPLPYTNFGGTIGAQFFDGQSQFFVELDNGAFFAPGNPTIINGLNSTYVSPFGNITPASTNGILDVDQLAFLESRIFHNVDDSSLGFFFYGFIPQIDANDFIRLLDTANLEVSGLNIRILGLPNIPGAPATFANIAPFAGGEGEGEFDPTSPEDLNLIATQAGEGSGQEASCWGDAANMATSGQSSTNSYSGGAEDILSGAAGCSSDI